SIGWHHDDTDILAPDTGVSIVSLGVERVLKLRAAVGDGFHYAEISLPPGSMLFMPSAMQGEWLHSMRRTDTMEPRISLSFRQIVTWPEVPPAVPER
ncbi:MAG: alpha-ketoglutarate-dependent dioxygenase AlkB, partial [Myxococcota bacterium]